MNLFICLSLMHTHENGKGSIFGAKLLYFEELSKKIV